MKKQQYHHKDLRQSLVHAGIEALEFGCTLELLSLRQLATALGVTAPSVYRHFESKEHLLAAIAVEGFLFLSDALEAAAENRPKPPKEYLLALGHAYLGFAEAHPQHYRVMFSHHVKGKARIPALEEAANQAFQYLFDASNACVSKPEEAMPLAISAWSKVHGYAMLSLEGQLDTLQSFPAFDKQSVLLF